MTRAHHHLAVALALAGAACTPQGEVLLPIDEPLGPVTARDVAVEAGYVDDTWGWQRARGAAIDDFDGDGVLDVFVGNPGDRSYLLMGRSGSEGLRFEPGTVLFDGEIAWGAVAGDVDHDGDPDLYVTVGGNERGGEGVSRLLRNDGTVGDGVVFTDITEAAGVPDRDDTGELVDNFHAGAFTWDMDLDGDLDLFSASGIIPATLVGRLPEGSRMGLNYVLDNQGGGVFVERRDELGMGAQWGSRNSQAFDVDGDGDLDLFENNWGGPNLWWRNELVPSGTLSFTEYTDAWSLGGSDLRFPMQKTSQAAIPLDANQDGWTDLLIVRSGDGRDPGEPEAHANGHLLFLNVEGRGFVEVADATGINAEFEARRAHTGPAAMGCTVADINLDGIPDLVVGKGNPDTGWPNTLMVSSGEWVEVDTEEGVVRAPSFDSWSSLIDVPSEADTYRHATEHAHYPYRTHAVMFTDFDGDGQPELAVHNGGPHYEPLEFVAEPNRLFQFDLPADPAWLQLSLRGNGTTVPLDAPHTRVQVTVLGADGEERVHHAMHLRGVGFASDPGPLLIVGLGDATHVVSVAVDWTDGHRTLLDGVDPRTRLEVQR